MLGSSHMFKRHWEKYSLCAIAFYCLRCILFCGIYFSLSLNVHCGDDLWWSIAKSCIIPFFINLLGKILFLMFLDRFCSSRLACWYCVWKFSEFSAICFYEWFNIDTVSLLFAWIFDINNCLAWNSLCKSRDMLLEQCLKQCLWTVILQTIILFLKLALYQ